MPSVSDHDLDSLLAALVTGDEVGVTGSEIPFKLHSEESKRALYFYEKNRQYWASSARGPEVTALLQALDSPLPEIEVVATSEGSKKLHWQLVSIRAHRFGGLHVHCDETGKAPPIFQEHLGYPLVVVGGFNGAGKSSFLSAIVWALTGRALRSQNIPRALEEAVLAERLDETENETEDGEEIANVSTFPLPPPVVPVPSEKNLEILHDQPAEDTWVELTFRNVNGGTEKTVRRTLMRAGRKYRAEVEGLDELGLNKLALQVGTVMPAIAAQMRFDESKELGEAVAELTGLAPLTALGNHCRRLIDNQLRGKQVDASKETMEHSRTLFIRQKNQFVTHAEHHPKLEPPTKILPPNEGDKGAASEASLVAVTEHLRGLEVQAQADFEAILGTQPELPNDDAVRLLETIIKQADDALKGAELKSLPSLALAEKICDLENEDIEDAQAVIDQVLAKAHELADVLEHEEKAKRYQLYVRVAHWHEEHHGGAAFETCPVCSTNLNDVRRDANLDKGVREALEECRSSAAHLAQSAEKAEEEWDRTYLGSLPSYVRELIDKDLPAWLPELYKNAYTKELFAKSSFQNILGPLKESTGAIWQDMAAKFPEAAPFIEPQLPDVFPRITGLKKKLNATARIIALAKYWQQNKKIFETATTLLIGSSEEGEEKANPQKKLPLRRQLATLQAATENIHPIALGKGILDELTSHLEVWKTQVTRLEALEIAAVAVEPITRFPELVREEVGGLRTLLDEDIRKWVQRIYSAHYVDGPEYGGLNSDNKGLGLRAKFGKISVPAYDVLNASALRAHVWGFMLALWERVANRHGGIGLFLLDDPQILFDRRNAENLASAIPDMIESGMRPIITSNDKQFTAFIGDYCNARNHPNLKLGFMEISPISSSKPKADFIPSVDRLEQLANKWRQDRNQTHAAQEYVQGARIYLECRLWDLLATDPALLHKPTFGDLVGKLRQFGNQGQPPFSERPFETLLNNSALAIGADFYAVINKAHHEGIRLIGPADAMHVDQELTTVRNQVDACWTTYARLAGRLPAAEGEDDTDVQIPLPEAVALGERSFPVLGQLAARENGVPLADPNQSSTSFNITELGSVALYGIRAATLGVEALPGQTVIVSLDDEPSTGDLVIALSGDKVLARRLTYPHDARGQAILETSRIASIGVAQTYIRPKHITRILKIIGVLYDNLTFDGREEALPVDQSPALQSAVYAAEVKDSSAYPVAHDGDRVLLIPILIDELTDEKLAQLQGRIVAVEAFDPAGGTGEHFSYLKRLGISVPGQPGTRVLDNVGFSSSGTGEIVHFPILSGADNNLALTVNRLWRVVGVLFKS